MSEDRSKEKAAYEGVVLLGFSRSGTTLTRRLLNAHPTLCCPPETHLLHASARFIEEQQVARGVKLGVLTGCELAGIPQEKLLGSLRDLAFGYFREITEKEGKKVWVDKTPSNMFQIDPLEKFLGPSCRYIILVRHPLDVICSLRELCNETENYLFELHDYIRMHSSPLVAFAHAWADTYKRTLKFEADHPEWCVRLKYEDLVADPVNNLDRVFNFLGQPANATEIAEKGLKKRDTVGLGDWKAYKKSEISTSSVGRHSELSPPTIKRLLDIVGPVMKEFGYEMALPEEAEDDQTRRNLVLGLMSSKLLAEAREKKAAPGGAG